MMNGQTLVETERNGLASESIKSQLLTHVSSTNGVLARYRSAEIDRSAPRSNVHSLHAVLQKSHPIFARGDRSFGRRRDF